MKTAVAACALLLGSALPASAHVALSSLDIHLRGQTVEVAVVAQAFDLAHEIGIDPPDRLMDLAFLAQEHDAIVKLVESGIIISVDGETLAGAAWSMPAAAPERQLVRIRTQYELAHDAGRVTVSSRLFAYDSAHQTIVNVYEGDRLITQQVLDAERLAFDYFTTSPEGVRSVVRRFTLAGVQQMLSGYNHLLFVVALLLVGGTPRRLGAIAGAFTLSYSVALALGASHVVSLPLAVIAPGVALSVVYSGLDNLMIRGGRDMRVWVALAFGWLHGFSFANALGTMDRPVHKPAWALVSFNLGIEAAFLLAAIALVSLASLAALPGSVWRQRLATIASTVVAALGVASFIRHIAIR